MNERIKELAKQANSHHDNFFDLNYKELDVFLEKFAELIVRECVDVCNKIYFEHYPDAEEWERSEEGDAIKKHLGVEQ